jgi:hypothetical protein
VHLAAEDLPAQLDVAVGRDGCSAPQRRDRSFALGCLWLQ